MNNELGKQSGFAEFTLARITEKGIVVAKHIDLNVSLETMLTELSNQSDEFLEEFEYDLEKINNYFESF